MTVSNPTEEYELVIGLVAAAGTDLTLVENALRDRLKQFGYESEVIQVSSLIKVLAAELTTLVETPYAARINSYMTAGNEARRRWQQNDAWALAAVAEISRRREASSNVKKVAYIVRSLKHPDEAERMRQVYGPGFFLLGVYASEEERLSYLVNDKGCSASEAENLVLRDAEEQETYGQHTRDTFQLSDAFAALNHADVNKCKEQIWRTLDLLFGDPYVTPSIDEYSMFIAYAASLRSADLSRQVGAVVVSQQGELIATGANDVPRFGGGLYWSDDKADERDFKRGLDSNQFERDLIIERVMEKFVSRSGESKQEYLKRGRKQLADTGLLDLTEYGRAVHAEMEALLACGRSGVSPRNGVLYSTTFPCHNCAKHIVASGIRRVVYIEPYPKSKAQSLHGDAISFEPGTVEGKVSFVPFTGIGPRHFMDLFSMRLSSGRRVVRKDKETGEVVSHNKETAIPRVPMLTNTYLDREILAAGMLGEAMERQDGRAKEGQ